MPVLTRCLIALSLLTLVACGTDPTNAPNEPTGFVDDRPNTLLRLSFAQQKWQSAGIADYSYRYQQSCFCAPPARSPVLIQVRAGAVVDAVYAETGERVPDPRSLPTIDALFARLREAAADDAAEIRAEYDPLLGFPSQVYVDRSQLIADEELAYEAGAVTPLR